MTRLLLPLILLITFCTAATAQNAQYAFRVTFKDKKATTYSLSAPLQYLSQRAMDRRSKYNMQVDSTDLPVVKTYVDSVLHVTNGVLHLRSRWQNSCVILVEDSSSVLALQNISFVKSVRKVGYYGQGLHEKPAPDAGSGQSNTGGKPTGFDANYYGAAWDQIHLCHGEYLHQKGNTGEGKLIAVIDVGFTGVNVAHAFDSLFAQNRLMDTWNFIYDTAYVFDYGAHGCQVLSCMASLTPETHVGTAPHAMYALYATDDLTSEQAIEEDNFAAASERADSLGADLITTSLGYNYFDNAADSHTYSELNGNTTLVARACNAAARKGIMVIASAGNEGTSEWQHILTPGDADSALTVGSVTVQKVHSATSGKGPSSDGDMKPNVSAMGVAASVVNPNGAVLQQTGTSYATPIIAGLTTCLMQADPSMRPMEVLHLIQSVSDSFAHPNYEIGNGVPDFQKAYDLVTDIQDIVKVNDAFSIYPNPARNEIFVSAKNYNGNLNYSIFDLQGRIVQTGNVKTGGSIDIATLQSNLYFLKLNNASQFQVTKLIVR
jgi:serine protease AprX